MKSQDHHITVDIINSNYNIFKFTVNLFSIFNMDCGVFVVFI